MNISSTSPKIVQRPVQTQSQAENRSPQSITDRIIDATVDKTLAGTDRLAGAVSGLATGATAYLSKMPNLAANVVKSAHNLFQAEKIGPNIKFVAALATPLIAGLAVAGAGLGLVIAAGAGAVSGFQAHNADKPREFTIDQAVSKAWSQSREAVSEFGSDMVKSSQEVRDISVKPGDKLWDIPLPPFARSAKTVAATVAGLAMGGVGGIATAVATSGKEIVNAPKDMPENWNTNDFIGAAGSILAAPVTGLVHGLSKVVTTPIAAAATAWKADSLTQALKAGASESFDTNPSKLASGAGTLVGGLAVTPYLAATTAVRTAAGEISGTFSQVSGPNLDPASRVLTAVAGVLAAPVSGLAHGAATAISTPFASVLHGADKGYTGNTIGAGANAMEQLTQRPATGIGAAVGSAPIALASGVTTAGVAVGREVLVGLYDAAANEKLNFTGKVLDGVGGVPGDVVSGVIQGLGTVVNSFAQATAEGYSSGQASSGVKRGAEEAVKGIAVGIHPKSALETVSAEQA